MTQLSTINFLEAQRVAQQVLARAGAPAGCAADQCEMLLEAELRGRASHGLQRLPRVVERIHNGVIAPAERGEHHWRGEALLHVDGQRGMGPAVACGALDAISERAKRTGVAAAAIHNNNHIGMLALYAERVAAQGQVLIAVTTSEALMHPWGGRRAMIGTNPVAIGVPATPHPFVLDMATSLVSMGQIHDHANRGVPLQPGWALNADGEPTLDAGAARDGAIAPFGGAKGYALGLAFEVLVASLTASALGRDVRGTLDSDQVCNKGDFFVVLEPASNRAAAEVAAYLEALRAEAPRDPRHPVMVPGDRAQAERARRLEQGIDLPAPLWSRLCALAA
ncbi:Ldh family oxidoreductase [Pseudorhodoferax sp.]|uniref:Ldh family oxidoreductase n=1 Tax=Pseudorhodoferax sp. TaxID=1993553 RepID=UPI002DD6334B|nr:Ldh family oxidoreductase [Pseudorhodoferax sp.]